MNMLLAFQLLGWLMVLLASFQLAPIVTALVYGEPLLPFVFSAGVTAICGLPIALGVRPTTLRVRPRDGFFMVSASWVTASLFGALPYWTSGALAGADAVFESVAGFTTTGSTVFTSIESQSHSLLLWRSLTQWLGGMGIVLFTVALMPLLGIGGMQLFKAEVPGPVAEKIRPRIAETARQLWFIYVGLTAAEWIALAWAGMSPYEALCHALTTLSTGGFSTRDASLAAFESPAIEWIVIVFMVLAGMNFVLHYRLLSGRSSSVWRDTELRYFAGIVAVCSAVVAATIWHEGDAVRAAVFQVVSLVTTTGYATADYEAWPGLAQLLLLHLMIPGAMAGSTSGGVKSLRVVLGFRALRAAFAVVGHRNAVRPVVRYAGRPVGAEVIAGIWAFFAAYAGLVGATALVVAAAGYDPLTALSAALTAVGNVGPGLGEIGPTENFAHFPAGVKLLLSACMLAGRLELFTLLVLFTPGFWRR
ncbi:MAG: TrkH family potassium uptake protein [Myxococcota bacterium]